jgi:hypothetical protein
LSGRGKIKKKTISKRIKEEGNHSSTYFGGLFEGNELFLGIIV